MGKRRNGILSFWREISVRTFRLPLALVVAALVIFAAPLRSNAQLYIGIGSPPLLPAYTQPPVPAQGMIWTPGYWAYGGQGYYWVPGTWTYPPSPGLYYTPGYWGGASNGFTWNQGYWGPSVGYYGGVNYGAGYYGTGYVGGMWQGQNFAYNTAVTAVTPNVIRNVYVNRTVIVRNVNRVSYNGGRGGLTIRPTPAQIVVMRGRRYPLTAVQRAHIVAASRDRAYLASVNRGRPARVVVARPLTATHVAAPAHVAPPPVHHAAPAPVHAAAPPVHHPAPAPVHAAPPVHHPAPAHAAPPPHPAHAAPPPHPAHAAPPAHAPAPANGDHKPPKR
jgi:hypothetical protein